MRRKTGIIIGSLAIIVLASVLFYPFESVKSNVEQSPVVAFSAPGVDYEDNDIVTSYSAGEKIRGKVNLSLDGVNADSIVSSNFGGNITLIELLEANGFEEGDEFNCSLNNCQPDYTLGDEINQITLQDEERLIGFEASGPNVEINEVGFSLISDIGPSCNRQLNIDVLNANENYIINNLYTENTCATKSYGCFNPSASLSDASIGPDMYCQQIELPSAPAFKVGAKITKGTGNPEIKMKLYDEEKNILGECTLPTATLEVGDVSCNIAYNSPEQEKYFVCIEASSSTDYSLHTETSGETCGTPHLFNSELNRDYEIFAQALEFDSFSSLDKQINVNDDLFDSVFGQTLASYADDYIRNNYDKDCQDSSCVIPVSIFGQPQTITFNNVLFSYDSDGTDISNDRIYEVDLEPSTIESDEIEIDLEHADFVIPIGSDEDEFELFIDGHKVFEEDISIAESFDFSVSPRIVGFGQNSLFKIDARGNITRSVWDFGDGSAEQSVNGKEISHRYTQEGSFGLEVSVTRSDGTSTTKTFNVTVGDAQEIANITLADYRKRLNDFDKSVNNLTSWLRAPIKAQIDVASLNESLTGFERDYRNATDDDDFQNIMRSLIDFKVPKGIHKGEKGDDIPLLIGFDNINVGTIEEISSDQVSDQEALKGQIGGWMSENLDAKVTYEKIEAVYDDSTETLATVFKIETNPVKSVAEQSNLIVAYDISSNGDFKENYNQDTISGSTSFPIPTGQTNKIIEFVIFDDFSPDDLGAYISPVIQNLGEFDIDFSECNYNNICDPDETKNNCPADCSAGRWPWFFVWIAVLLFAALVAYIILQEWYKKNYENHLFKNKNDLYNLINFIYNARKQGLNNGQIKDKLNEAGWSGERISYALKKIDGKRVGMFEIPIFKFAENKKVKREIAKRQGGQVDARFIKRPNF